MNRFVGLLMAATLLAMPLSAHALTLKKGETIASGGGVNEKYSIGSISFFDAFEEDKLDWYDQSHLYRKSIKFLTEPDGNRFISLKSEIGQLSKFNRGQTKYVKDRVELGTNDLGSDIEGIEIWWGFRAKLPSDVKTINAKAITFSQFKQIQKRNKKDCHPGMYWRMNYEDKSAWYAVTDGFDNKHNKTRLAGQLSKDWSTFKIGTYFSRGNDGWLKAYRNGKLIYEYTGRTVVDEFPDCKPNQKMQTYLRIGVYRGSPTGWPNKKSDTLHFDDFVISNKKTEVEKFLTMSSSPSKSYMYGANPPKASIASVKKGLRTSVPFRSCLIQNGFSEDIVGMMRFRPQAPGVRPMLENVTTLEECIKLLTD